MHEIEQIIKKEVIYQGRYLQLERFHVLFPDGLKGDREIIRLRDSVAVFPVDEEGRVHLVKQFRPAIEKTITEIPAGVVDKGETAAEAAIRECEEETGYVPGRLIELITYAHAEGYSTAFMTLFLGLNLKYTGNVQLDTTEFLEPCAMPFSELKKSVASGKIIDSKTILGTMLAESRTRGIG